MLKSRLQLINDIFDNEVSLDIGADHGFLTISLLDNKIVSSAKIVEVNKGPYDNSLNNIIKHGYKDQVEVFLGDGLKPFDEPFGEEIGVIIAGMGGKLIADILFNNPQILGNASLYLQPNNGEMYLRNELIKHGYAIKSDLLVEDTNIIYTVIKAVKGEQKLSDKEYLYGYHFDNKNELFQKRFSEELEHLYATIAKIPKGSNNYDEFEKKINTLKEVLGE